MSNGLGGVGWEIDRDIFMTGVSNCSSDEVLDPIRVDVPWEVMDRTLGLVLARGRGDRPGR